MTRDDLFAHLALRGKFLTPEQVEDSRKLQAVLAQNGFPMTLPEILGKKEYLTPDQLRLLHVGLRYEETREEDLALGAFIVRQGFLPEDKVKECLALQEIPFKEGQPFPRLSEILVQKGHVSAGQLQVIERARQQLDPTLKTRPSSSTLPAYKASSPTKGSSGRIPAPLSPQAIQAGLALEGLRVAYRTSAVPDTPAEPPVSVLEIQGLLDGHTFKKFGEYLNGLINSGLVRLLLNCDRLDYVSSAGIGILGGAAKRCRDAQGDLRLCGVQEGVMKVISLVGLQSMLRTFDGERVALSSFKP